MPHKELSCEVQMADRGRLDLLVARLLGFSRSRVRGLIDHGGVRVNAELAGDGGVLLAAGDLLQLSYDSERRYKEKPVQRAPRGFALVYSDEHFVVVHKEAGVLTVPTDRREAHTLIDLVAGHLNQGRQRRSTLAAVHRLDRETSGLLVFGRTPAIARSLSAQFAARKPEREYAALVAGVVAKDEGEIRSHLQSDEHLYQRSAAVGELAVTHFTVQQRYKDSTLVSVKLETGRRHQIRVHMAELGHPVLGDRRYRPEQAAHAGWPYQRLALHARVLGFSHPVSKEALRFVAELPGEFGRFHRTQT